MKFQILTLTALVALASAAETTTTIKPTAVIPNPPGIVCPMTVCPTSSSSLSKRDIECPVTCPHECEVIDDHCCPGQKKAVCKVSVSSGTPSGSSTSSVGITPAPSSPTVNPSSSAVSPSVSPATTSKPSAANMNTASILSTFMLAALLTVGLNQL